MICYGCGKEIHKTAKSCPSCGARRTGSRSRKTAAILALFFGTFGVHKFYLGQVLQGMLYLIFCVTGIPTLISLIEFIIYLTDNDEIFEARYLK